MSKTIEDNNKKLLALGAMHEQARIRKLLESAINNPLIDSIPTSMVIGLLLAVLDAKDDDEEKEEENE
jgi:hypothetical protein